MSFYTRQCDIVTKIPHNCFDNRFPITPFELCYFCKKRTCLVARRTQITNLANINIPFVLCDECYQTTCYNEDFLNYLKTACKNYKNYK